MTISSHCGHQIDSLFLLHDHQDPLRPPNPDSRCPNQICWCWFVSSPTKSTKYSFQSSWKRKAEFAIDRRFMTERLFWRHGHNQLSSSTSPHILGPTIRFCFLISLSVSSLIPILSFAISHSGCCNPFPSVRSQHPWGACSPGSSERLGAAAAANGVPDQKLGVSGAASGSTFSKNYRLRYLSNCIIFYNKYLETWWSHHHLPLDAKSSLDLEYFGWRFLIWN